MPPFCNFLHRNARVLYAGAIISQTEPTLLFSPEAFSSSNAPNVVWRPSLSAAFRLPSRGRERRGNNWEEEGRGRSEGEVLQGRGSCANFQNSAPMAVNITPLKK